MKHKFLKSLISILDGALEILIRKLKINLDMGNTLHIIGNGFDLHHGLQTQYSDFADWLKRVEPKLNLFFLTEAFGCSEDELWANFESRLGEMNPILYLKQEVYDLYDHEEEEYIGDKMGQYVDSYFLDSFNTVLNKFCEWARQIDVSSVLSDEQNLKTNFGFDNNGLFITFNYTDTLEKAYHISQPSILHIHGDANNPNAPIIVGHNSDYKKYQKQVSQYMEQFMSSDAEDTMKKMLNELQRFKKPIEQRIGMCNAFLENREIDHIVVLGLSFGEVDFPYLKNIAERYPNALWTISVHDEQDEDKAKTMTQRLGVSAKLVDW